jgi:hypothetical protein
LIAEMEEHRRAGIGDLRQAAEGVLSVLSAADHLLDALIEPKYDRWERLAACERLVGAAAEASCRTIAADRGQDEAMRSAAREVIEALRLRGSHVQAAATAPGPDRSRDVQAARGAPPPDTSTLVEAADRPMIAAPAPKSRRLPFWRKRC